jgi:flagellar biosynthesis/type III secretory pathway protein FliH
VLAALEACAAGIERALGAVPGLVRGNLQQVAALATEVGLTLARDVVADAADRGLVDPTEAVLRCLSQATRADDTEPLSISLHPDDLAVVAGALAHHEAVRARTARAHFVPDAAVPRGSARVHTGAGKLAYDPREVLARMTAAVRAQAAP